MSADLPLIIGLVALVVAAIFLAAAEAALLRVPRVRIAVRADAGDRRATRTLGLLDDLPRVMNTVLLAVLLVQIGSATVVGVLAERHFGSLGITVASVLLTLVLFVYAEAIPKTYALRHPARVSLFVSGAVALLKTLLRPVVSLLVAFADLQAPGEGISPTAGVSEEELRRLAAEAASVGEIESSDIELLERSFELGDATVDEVLVPRPDVVGVAADTLARDALDVAFRSGHRRLPVYEGDLDHIVGVVRLRQLAASVAGGADTTVEKLATQVMVVPETKAVVALLREMQGAGQHFAVAVDEHGGTVGIVTIEDVVAELVGEITDEGQQRQDPIRLVGADRWLVDAAVDVDDLSDALGVDLPAQDWNTVGGLVIHLAGSIPAVGDEVEAGGYRFRVLRATPKRVQQVEVSR